MVIRIIKKGSRPTPPPTPSLVPRDHAEKASHGKLLDSTCKTVISMHPGAVVSWYLITSYAYYVHDMALISDGLYDELCQRLDTHWDAVQVHPHAHLLDREAIKAGTAYQLRAENYPTMVKAATRNLVRTDWGVTIPMT